jgi:hypothetical protein
MFRVAELYDVEAARAEWGCSPVLFDSSFWMAGGGVCAQTGRAPNEGKLQLHCVTAQPKLSVSIEAHSCLRF